MSGYHTGRLEDIEKKLDAENSAIGWMDLVLFRRKKKVDSMDGMKRVTLVTRKASPEISYFCAL